MRQGCPLGTPMPRKPATPHAQKDNLLRLIRAMRGVRPPGCSQIAAPSFSRYRFLRDVRSKGSANLCAAVHAIRWMANPRRSRRRPKCANRCTTSSAMDVGTSTGALRVERNGSGLSRKRTWALNQEPGGRLSLSPEGRLAGGTLMRFETWLRSKD